MNSLDVFNASSNAVGWVGWPYGGRVSVIVHRRSHLPERAVLCGYYPHVALEVIAPENRHPERPFQPQELPRPPQGLEAAQYLWVQPPPLVPILELAAPVRQQPLVDPFVDVRENQLGRFRLRRRLRSLLRFGQAFAGNVVVFVLAHDTPPADMRTAFFS